MRKFTGYISALLLAIGMLYMLYILLSSFIEPYTYAPKSTTARVINQTYECIDLINSETNLDALLGTDSNSLKMNENLTGWFRKHNLLVEAEVSQGPISFLADSWGRPLLIFRSGDLPTNSLEALFKMARQHHIAIWSAGRNGTNDWGHFDDVIYKP